jgi:rubrerythrin
MLAIDIVDVKKDDITIDKKLTVTDNVDTSLQELQYSIVETNAVVAKESLNLSSIYLEEKRMELVLDDLTVANESIVSRIMYSISYIFKKIIDFMSNIMKYVFKLFKRIFDFIMGLFRSKDKAGGGGGGGTMRDKIKRKKEDIEKEVEEFKKEPSQRSEEDVKVYIDKYRNAAASGIYSHDTFFFMPRANEDIITAQDVIYYIEVLTKSYSNKIGMLSSYLFTSPYSITNILLGLGGKSTIVSLVKEVMQYYYTDIAFTELNAKGKADIYKTVSRHLEGKVEAIKYDIETITGILESQSSPDSAIGVLTFNGRTIPVPDNIAAKHAEEDNILGDGFLVKRSLVAVTSTKFTYVKYIYDKKKEETLKANIDKVFDMWGNGDESYSLDDAMIALLELIENATGAFRIAITEYDVSADKPSLDEVRGMIKDISITEEAHRTLLEQALVLYENIDQTTKQYLKTCSVNVTAAERKYKGAVGAVKEIDDIIKSAIKNTTDEDKIKAFNTIVRKISSIVNNVNNNTIVPLKEFMGLTKDAGSDAMKYLVTSYDTKHRDAKRSSYTTLNFLVDIYGIYKFEEASLVVSR